MRQQPFLIPGETYGASPSPLPRPRSSRLLPILVVAWLLGGLALLVVRLSSGKHETGKAAVERAKTPIAVVSPEDLLRHMDAFDDELAAAAAKLHRAQDHITHALPGVHRNYLLVEQNHLENALAITDAARRDLEQSRQDFEIVLNSLKKEHQLQ